jgi:FtsP/CotA-like multicopper oxidase with cupredoxin domain
MPPRFVRPARAVLWLAPALALLLSPTPRHAQEPPEQGAPERAEYPFRAQEEVLLAAGSASGLPLVQPNDNRTPAGTSVDGVRTIELEVSEADWRVESEGGPGLRVSAIGEVGHAPSVPAPLLRVEEGTPLRVSVANRLSVPVRVFGLHRRPAADDHPPTVLEAGETRIFEFEAGAPGTYIYRVKEGTEDRPGPRGPNSRPAEREQLAGALVVDPRGEVSADRIMVINIFREPMEGAPRLRALTINGRSWPFTERLQLEVGTPERWRVVNASIREHPMHLHGFYFSVLGRGTEGADTTYAERDHRLVVTETMHAGTTVLMEWTPTRPGRWLFHCHLSFHVEARNRLPGAAEADPEHAHAHMSGLVMGIEVAPGPSDLVARGDPVPVDLIMREYADEKGYRFGFDVDDEVPGPDDETPGPLLVFNQYQAVDVTVHNEMERSTGVHWHGLELDAWADGVPDWSASDGRMSPVIEPGESFTYRLSLMRPGTFIYHSHMNDVVQLSGGLYGPLIVLPPGETFDGEHDHPMVFGWRDPVPRSKEDIELNGQGELPEATTSVGETHRFRVINIAPAGIISAWLMRDGESLPIRLLAKDGADLPEHQQVEAGALPEIGVGETADFTWTPSEPGEYEIRVGFAPDPDLSIRQTWLVTQEPPTGR